jgi:hypothetical protein
MCRGGKLLSANIKGNVCIASADTLFFLEADNLHLPQLPNSLTIRKHPDIVVPVASCGGKDVIDITKTTKTWVESYRASCAADERTIAGALQQEERRDTGVENAAKTTEKSDTMKPLLHLSVGNVGVIGALEGSSHDTRPFTETKVLDLSVVCLLFCASAHRFKCECVYVNI